jgi:hypothetical protein
MQKGLGFGSINTVKPKPVKTPVDNMILQKDIEPGEELFTCLLGSIENKTTPGLNHDSYFTFGYIVRDLVKQAGLAEPYWVPVDKSSGF